MRRFEGNIVLVTGSGRGIGREIALRFAREGADIAVNFFRNRKPAEETAELIRETGQRAVVIKANVGELEDLERMFSVTADTMGGLDIFVHNAASGYNRPAMQQRPKGWQWTMDINARALLFGAQHAVPLMEARGGGAIVAISSLGSQRVLDEYVVVGSSKAALEALVRYLGAELASANIRVNAVSPGVVLTEALEHFATFQDTGQEIISKMTQRTPTGRLCTPSDVADVVTFLCTSQASMICGQTITVDGGYSLLAF